MKCKALKEFVSAVFGNVDKGRVLELDAGIAPKYKAAGLVAYLECEKPPEDFIQAEPNLSASPPAQVLPQTIVEKPNRGRKKGQKNGQ